jgi:hypothetical protein
MDYRQKQNVIKGCAIAGGVLAFLADLIGSQWYYQNAGQLGAAGAAGRGVGSIGSAFGGAILGALIGMIIALVVPKEKTTCTKCGSAAAIAADKSLMNGKPYPNRCACGHTWG